MTHPPLHQRSANHTFIPPLINVVKPSRTFWVILQTDNYQQQKTESPGWGNNRFRPRWLTMTEGFIVVNIACITRHNNHAIRKCAFSPNCWGTGGGWVWGGNGHLLEAYSTKPTCKPQSTMCSFRDLRRDAVAVVAVAGRGKLKNVR